MNNLPPMIVTKPIRKHFTHREITTIAAALHVWQEIIAYKLPYPVKDLDPETIDDIASYGGLFEPLDADEIDELLKRLGRRPIGEGN